MIQMNASDLGRDWLEWSQRVKERGQILVLRAEGEPAAVMMGFDAFETLLGVSLPGGAELLDLHTFQERFREALSAAGFRTRDDLVAMIREIKREMADERDRSRAASA